MEVRSLFYNVESDFKLFTGGFGGNVPIFGGYGGGSSNGGAFGGTFSSGPNGISVTPLGNRFGETNGGLLTTHI